MIKNSLQSEYKSNIPQHNKGHIDKPSAYHHTQWWKAESISSKIRSKTRMSTLNSFVQCNQSPSNSSQTRKRKKSKLKKKENCHCLQMTWYYIPKILKTPLKPTKTYQWIQWSCKIQNSYVEICCFFMYQQWTISKIKRTIPFITTSKRVK